jgi:hypothetical protein
MELLPTDPYVLIDPGIVLNTKNPPRNQPAVHTRLGKLSYTIHFQTILLELLLTDPYVLIDPGTALNKKKTRNQPGPQQAWKT